MEPASIPVTKKGRGSIEDPEVLENVPGHIIPILEREFDDFDTTAAKFMRGEPSRRRVASVLWTWASRRARTLAASSGASRSNCSQPDMRRRSPHGGAASSSMSKTIKP
jgi:hypothetical protein